MRLAEPKPLPPPPFGQQPPPTSGKPLAVGSGPETAASYLGRLNLSLVRAHALNPSSTDPEHPIKTAVGGSRVPPISRSPWLYVESVYRDILTAYLGVSPFEFGASPLQDVASAEEPALAPQIIARLALRGAPQATPTSPPLSAARPWTPWKRSVPWSPAPSPPLEPHPRHDNNGGSWRLRGGDGSLRHAPAPELGARSRGRPGPHLAGPLCTNPLPLRPPVGG